MLGLLCWSTSSIEIRARPLQDLKNIALIAISFILCLVTLRFDGRQVIKDSCLSSCSLLSHSSPSTALPAIPSAACASSVSIGCLFVGAARTCWPERGGAARIVGCVQSIAEMVQKMRAQACRRRSSLPIGGRGRSVDGEEGAEPSVVQVQSKRGLHALQQRVEGKVLAAEAEEGVAQD